MIQLIDKSNYLKVVFVGQNKSEFGLKKSFEFTENNDGSFRLLKNGIEIADNKVYSDFSTDGVTPFASLSAFEAFALANSGPNFNTGGATPLNSESTDNKQAVLAYDATGNEYPSSKSLYQEINLTVNKTLEQADFLPDVNNVFDFVVSSGTVTVTGTTGQTGNKAPCEVVGDSIKTIEFVKGTAGRTFLVLGYNSITQACGVLISWNSGSVYGTVYNINLSNGTLTSIAGNTISHMTNGQAGKIVVTGDVIELYKGTTLALTLNYATLAGLGAWVTNRNLGLGGYSNSSSLINDGTVLFSSVVLKSPTEIVHEPIFAPIDDVTKSPYKTFSSEKIDDLLVGKLRGLKVSVIGDSITENSTSYGLSALNKDWLSLLSIKYDWLVNRQAAGGRCIAEKGADVCFTTDSIWQALNSTFTPDVILMFGGHNDFGPDQILLGALSDSVKTTFYGGMKYVSSSVNNRYKTTKIFWITPIQCGTTVYNTTEIQQNTTTNLYLYQFTNIMKEISDIYGIGVIDAHAKSGLTFQNMASGFFSSDGTHPNDAGHVKIANLVELELLQQL